jgi:lipopolysaccharide/colanic/teichoic acid biosynthesis glycosyltransferase
VALLLVTDTLAIVVALLIATLARYAIDLLRPLPGPQPTAIPIVVALWLLALVLMGGYRMEGVGSGYEEFRRVLFATILALGCIFAISFLENQRTLPRAFLLLAWIMSIVTISAGRVLVRQVVRATARRGKHLRRVLIVGGNKQGIQVADDLRSDPGASSEVCGWLDDYKPKGQWVGGFEVLGEPMQLYEVARTVGATHAIVVESALSWESLRFVVRSMHLGRGPAILLAPGMLGINATPLHLSQIGSTLLLAPHATRIYGLEAFLKRGLDITISVPALLLSLPFLAAAFSWSRATGRHALLSRPSRGRHGVHFGLLILDGTRLERLHLSRLPSLWQVVIGRMSMIGPRPLVEGQEREYAPWADILSALKPGFIGPWWVQGRQVDSLEEEVAADLRYARSYTFWMDLRILWSVLQALFGGKMAAERTQSDPVKRVAESALEGGVQQ